MLNCLAGNFMDALLGILADSILARPHSAVNRAPDS